MSDVVKPVVDYAVNRPPHPLDFGGAEISVRGGEEVSAINQLEERTSHCYDGTQVESTKNGWSTSR